jgi:Flp pilus assembly protein protease CpaA
LWTDSLWNHDWLLLQWSAAIGASTAAAVCDLRFRKIPNRLTGLCFLGGLIWAVTAAGLPGLADGLAGCAIMMLPFLVLFVFAGGGAGDAKMMGALGMWLGTRNGAAALVAVAVSGAVLGVAYAISKKRSRLLLENLSQMGRAALAATAAGLGPAGAEVLLPPKEKMLPMPYGAAILAGVCLAAGGTWLWRG